MTSNQFKYNKDETSGKKEKPASRRKSKLKTGKFTEQMNKLGEFIDSPRFKIISGLSLLIFSIFLVISFISFLFTGRTDFNEIQGRGLWDFLFLSDIQVENWMGNLGAAVSHLFIYKWFGVSSFLFPFLIFLLGFKVLFKIYLLPLNKTLRHSAFLIFWICLTAGFIFFESEYKFTYGQVGYFLNEWFHRVIGGIGTGFFIAFSLLTYIVLNFNVSEWFKKSDKQDELSNSETTDLEENSIVEFVESEQESEEETLVEVEDAIPAEEESQELEIENTEEKEETGVSLDIEPEKPANENEEPSKSEEDIELSVETTDSADEQLSDKKLEKLRSDLGDYDPTLDLSDYRIPPVDLLQEYESGDIGVNKEELEANKNKIVKSLENYNIKIQSIKATIGPTVTLYEIVPAAGIRISKIKNLEDDIALSLSALGIRIIAPIPGKGTIGIEVPNQTPNTVSMKTVIVSKKFQEAKMELPVVMGKTISNESFVFDLTKMPHLLMAGATGQGKSVGLNAVLTSLLYKKHPAQLKFVLVDPKKVELTLYNKIERHFLAKLPDSDEAIITDNQKVITTLNSLCLEMDNRYELLKSAFVRNIKEYNQKFIARKLNPENGHRYLPYIVLVVDEFADLIMTAGREVEQPIARLAQLARAIGIHLIIATQRPSTNIITGSIKANFPARIAFRVTSGIDSRTILDAGGAEQLIGRGDMLLSTGNDLIRLQCAFVDTPEVEKLCEFIGDQRGYPDAFLLPEYIDESSSAGGGIDADDRDAMFEEAARLVVQHQQGSASLLQRRLKLGYNRAGRIIDQLEAAGIIGPFEGSKARKVLVADETSLDQFLNSTDE